jgi:hypothetical protein
MYFQSLQETCSKEISNPFYFTRPPRSYVNPSYNLVPDSFAPAFLQPGRRTRRDLKICEYGAVTLNSFVIEPSLVAVPVRASMGSHYTLMCILLFLPSFLVSATRNGSAMVELTCLRRKFVIYRYVLKAFLEYPSCNLI